MAPEKPQSFTGTKAERKARESKVTDMRADMQKHKDKVRCEGATHTEKCICV